jgi:hypothetical protein
LTCAVCASRSVRDLLVVALALDRDWYVSALPNQGHAGEDGGPQIDGCESEYEHCAAMGTRGDLHLVLEEGMLLIGADVKVDVVGPKTFIERNAYPISVHQLVQPFLSRTTPLIVAMTSFFDRCANVAGVLHT